MKKNYIQFWNFFFETLSSKYIYRDVKCSFLNAAPKNLPEDRSFFPFKYRKRIENVNKL